MSINKIIDVSALLWIVVQVFTGRLVINGSCLVVFQEYLRWPGMSKG